MHFFEQILNFNFASIIANRLMHNFQVSLFYAFPSLKILLDGE
jgi:hypothetical protein